MKCLLMGKDLAKFQHLDVRGVGGCTLKNACECVHTDAHMCVVVDVIQQLSYMSRCCTFANFT